MSSDEADVRSFIQRYGDALGAGDLDTIVECWGIPALVLSDAGIQPVTDSAQVRQFFGMGVAAYRSRGVVAARATVSGVERLGESVFSVDVRWANLNGDGAEVSSEDWRYTLRADPGGPLRIHVATLKSRP